MSKSLKKYYGFTLVELIIVITILAILSTIAFVSFNGYTIKSNDTNRISSLKNIEKGLQIFSVNSGVFPLPDNKIDILASGSVIGYQGNAGDNVLNIIKSTKALDPLDNTFYTYSIDKTKTKFKLLGLLQKNELSLVSNAYADNQRYFYTLGNDSLGSYTDNNFKPIQNVVSSLELVGNTGSYIGVVNQNQVYYGNEISSTYTNSFSGITCRDILTKNPSLYGISGYYNLNGTGTYTTYCDMSYDGGGWTLIYSALNDNTAVTRADNLKLRSNTFFGSGIIKSLAKYASGVYITDNSGGYIQTKTTDTQVIANMRLGKTLNGGYGLGVDTTTSWNGSKVSYLSWINTNQTYYDQITASSVDFLFIWCGGNNNGTHIGSNAGGSKVWQFQTTQLNMDIYIK